MRARACASFLAGNLKLKPATSLKLRTIFVVCAIFLAFSRQNIVQIFHKRKTFNNITSKVQVKGAMNNVCSPFLHPQQVPGTPLFVCDRPSTICSPGSCVPDIDDHQSNPFLPYGRRTPKSAPSTPGMTVPSCSASPALSIKNLNDRRLSARSRKLKDSREQSIQSTTPKLEQVVPSCSPLPSSTNPPQMINTDKKDSESTKQISLFSGDDIFA